MKAQFESLLNSKYYIQNSDRTRLNLKALTTKYTVNATHFQVHNKYESGGERL